MIPATVTLFALRETARRRLGDDALYWSNDTLEGYLIDGYNDLVRRTRAIWDMVYAESLPRSFSYTAPFEADIAGFNSGRANFTAEFERATGFVAEHHVAGPANHTAPFEATDGTLEASGASTAVADTAELPRSVVEIERPMWDERAIGVLSQREAASRDSRYELTRGETYALVPQGQGLRTVRKVRAPSAYGDTYTVNGSWGIARDLTDLDAGSASGTWGFPRRIPGYHPMGAETFGFPRRPFRDGKNVRIEHWRLGRLVRDLGDSFEVPEWATVYIRDYAVAQCYAAHGPAQDTRMGEHYQRRYERGVARLGQRVAAQQRARVGRMGGAAEQRSPALRVPSLPWQFGVAVSR